jgi:predicted Zn-dependent protease with MMP-like domain
MAIVAHAAQAAGLAARMCKEHGLLPADIYRRGLVKVLQASLLKVGQYIPGVVLHDADDLV